MKKAVLASNNQHKLEEIQAILKNFDYELLTMADVGLGDFEIEENGDTFEANSLIKAQAVFEKTGLPTLADDSGLMVDALGGAPGVYSARYSGEDKNYSANNEKLLRELGTASEAERGAKFVTVITMMFGDQDILVARGEVLGHIGFELMGTQGFGYDPLFIETASQKTFAQMNAEEKNAISHRARALMALQDMLVRRG